MNKTTKKSIVNSLVDGFGDDTRKYIRELEADINNINGLSIMKWNSVYNNLIKNPNCEGILFNFVRRGCWNMVMGYDIKERTLISFMREERFSELKKEINSGHYLYAMSGVLNVGLNEEEQISFFCDEDKKKRSEKTTNDILEQFKIDKESIDKYAVVLIREKNFEVFNVRMCIADSNLDITEQENWNEFINYDESLIVDNVKEDSLFNLPAVSLGKESLKLKSKQKMLVKKKENNKEKKID